MRRIRCHITDRVQRSNKFVELRKYWGPANCCNICTLLPERYRRMVVNALEEEKRKDKKKNGR
jgi:hypothetical protein